MKSCATGSRVATTLAGEVKRAGTDKLRRDETRRDETSKEYRGNRDQNLWAGWRDRGLAR